MYYYYLQCSEPGGKSIFLGENCNPTFCLLGNLLAAGPTSLTGRGRGLSFGLGSRRGAAGNLLASA